MTRIVTTVVLIFSMLATCFAQQFQVTRNDYERVDISFSAPEITSAVVKTPQGFFTQISMDEFYPSVIVGQPQLPVMVKLLEIPVCDSVVATVKNAQYMEVDASTLGIQYPLYPAQPSYAKSYRGERPFVRDQQTYSRDAFYAEPLVRVEKTGTMRDITLANLYISPVSYNPVTGKVRICRSMDIEVSYVNANLPATYELKTRYGSPMFQSAANAVANPMPRNREEFNASPIRYLIIAHSMFRNNDNLELFVNWKKRLGYIVDVVYTGDANVGTTTTSIKNYILSQYNSATASNPAPTFLLFVGDHGQVPAFSSTEQNSHVTDLYYACWTTGDNIPDCYYGRFSAQNASQLAPQITKTLQYEQYTMPDPSYLGKAVLIAGTDNNWSDTHADGQINYIYNNYINTTSTTHQYSTVYKHNYNCSSQAATIRSEIGAGVGWANYTAHGDVTEWYDPSFTTSHIPSMNNLDKYGVMIGNCCLTGKFNEECFGEMLLRTDKKGAMAYIGASEVSYWDEDVYWSVGKRSSVTANMTYQANNLGAYDRIFHTHNESHDVWATTLGGFLTAGNLAVQSSSSSRKKYYWEIYHIFGDPSIRPYLGMPSQMNVSALPAVPVGTQSYNVSAVPYAYVALTTGGNIVTATFADASGNATLDLSNVTTPGEYELAIGAQNHVQYFQTINIIVPSGPYVVASNVSLPNDVYPINGTSVNWNLEVSNLGVDNASNVTAQMTALTPGFTVTQGSATFNTLAPNAIQSMPNAFTVSIPENAEDSTRATFRVTTTWQGGNSTKDVNLTVIAPKLAVTETNIQGPSTAAALEPGDAATATITISNSGHAPASDILIDLTCNYSGVTVTSPSQIVAWIGAGESISHTFNLQIANSVPNLSIVPLYFHTIKGDKHVIDTLSISIGKATEDFETGDFTRFNWVQNQNPWTITNQAPYAGNYCARSKENLDNGSWYNVSRSSFSITVNCLMEAPVSYFRKVSSEANYDKFKFYIDNNETDNASGNEGWTQKSFPVSAGQHTFMFAYEKDYSTTSGDDCAWVDNIVLPGLGNLVTEDINDPVGIESLSRDAFSVVLYPNPTSGNLQLRSSELPLAKVQVFDLFGKMLTEQDLNDLNGSVSLSGLASGVYVVKVFAENQTVVTRKVVKQ
ncbi:MAG: T9SS type A sorting domain-containing protein [Bacteroidales bacterium]|nr:T9SS type A sorting domain-containing protein [Bacteroidales bacterium]